MKIVAALDHAMAYTDTARIWELEIKFNQLDRASDGYCERQLRPLLQPYGVEFTGVLDYQMDEYIGKLLAQAGSDIKKANQLVPSD